MEYEVTREYLERRYRDSLAMAERAVDPAIARVHREFAGKYARAIEKMALPARRGDGFAGGGAPEAA